MTRLAQMVCLTLALFIIVTMAGAKNPPALQFAVPEQRNMVEMDKDGNVVWYAPKDEVARNLLITLAQANQKNAQLEQNLKLLMDAVNSDKAAVAAVKKFTDARAAAIEKAKAPKPEAKAEAKPMSKDEKDFIERGKKEVLKK